MTHPSPYGSTPGGQEYYDTREKYRSSPSATPSPRGAYYHPHTPQRPQTRASHSRNYSSGGAFNDYSSPRPNAAFSPRYTSDGQYATQFANVSTQKHHYGPSPSTPRTPKRERRSSFSYYRPSYNEESDEDEIFVVDGVTYVLPARSRSRRYSSNRGQQQYYQHRSSRARGTDYYYAQGYPYYDYDPASARYDSQQPEATPKRSHPRRSSTSMGNQRPATARPASSHQRKSSGAGPTAPPPTPKATEADAKKFRIPAGYSLKNWDPTEQPILLLGSVFDANSLGKWIYDWTVYHHGPATPISDMAGDLWLLLIQLAGKVKRAEACVTKIRSQENRDMVEDFILSGERLSDKLRKLLKSSEAPMLKSSSKHKSKDQVASQLGKNAGIEFVETLFGRERELERTEKFMQNVRLWNLRFDANCEEIIRNPHT